MSCAEALLPEFDREMANTRKVLERIPDDTLDWKPHPLPPSEYGPYRVTIQMHREPGSRTVVRQVTLLAPA